MEPFSSQLSPVGGGGGFNTLRQEVGSGGGLKDRLRTTFYPDDDVAALVVLRGPSTLWGDSVRF